ncbi:hypothetical protein ON010_g14839 [Phytophthora cinnamomi]|nr:hypothetical protein ON010_g14839 [Phytophthora cinnamomi]
MYCSTKTGSARKRSTEFKAVSSSRAQLNRAAGAQTKRDTARGSTGGPSMSLASSAALNKVAQEVMPPKSAPEPLGVLRGHGAPVNSVGFLTASTIVSSAGDGAVKIWDLRSRRELATNPTAHSKAGVLHSAALRGSAVSKQTFVTQGRDGFVKLWDTQSFGAAAEPITKFYCGSYSFTKFATLRWPGDEDAAENANLIVCPSSVDNKLLVYDIRADSSSPASTLTVPDAASKRGMCVSLSLFNSSVERSEDGARGNLQTYIAAGFEGGQLAIMDLRSGGKVACETTVAQGANACRPSAGLRAKSCTQQTLTWRHTHSSHGHSTPAHTEDSAAYALGKTSALSPPLAGTIVESVFALDFSADSALLTSCSKDQKIALWSLYPPSAAAASSALRPY